VVEPRPGDRIQFDASSSSDPDGEIVEYAWDWDSDGSYNETITDPLIEHTFTSAGSHRVTLRVTDDDGATGTITKTVSVGEKEPPQASFTFSPAEPSILDTVQFTDTSTDPDGQIIKWGWNFGDGSTSSAPNPTHQYTEKKAFTVTLTVTDNDGLADTQTASITVVNIPPKSSFTFSPKRPYSNQPVSFDASDSTDKDGTITSYSWDINGDGKEDAHGEKATWTFTEPGTFTVTLTVTDNDGATSVQESEITHRVALADYPVPLVATAVIPLLNDGNAADDQANYHRAIALYEEARTVCREISDRRGEANSSIGLGNSYWSLAEYERAIDYHTQALVIFQEIGDRSGKAQSLNNLGICYDSLAEYEQAIDCHEQSLVIFQEIGDRSGEAQSLNNLGICHDSLAEYKQAIGYHEQSLAIFQEIGGRRGEAASFGNLGLCYRSLGDYRKAIDYHDESLAIEREIGNPGGEARSLGNLGESYRLLGDYHKAIEYYDKSLTIFQEIEDRLGEAASLGNLGHCYRSLGAYGRAIDFYENALEIFHDIRFPLGEAEFFHSLGDCYSALGDYDKAIDCSEQALAIHHEIGARDGERASLECLGGCYFQWAQYQQAINYAQKALAIAREVGVRGGEASSLGLLGRCYDQLGQYQRAIEYHVQALAIAQEIGARSLETTCLNDLGAPYRKLGDYQEAISLHTKALAIAQEIGTRPLEAAALDNLGNCYRETGDYEEAFNHFMMAQAIFQEIGSLPKQAEGLNNLGLSYEVMENYPMAIDCYTHSLTIAQEIGLSGTAWKAQRGLGKAHWQMGELDLAREKYEQAIAAVEAISGRIQVKGLFRSYLASVQQLYQEYFELLLDMGRAEETIVVSERLRARTFLDLLAQSSEQTLEHLATRGIAGVVDAVAIEQDIQDMVAALPEETATLAYQVINEATYVWVITGGIWHGPCEIPHCREELMHKVIECRQQIEQADPMANRNLAILYDWLIRPVENLLPQADEDSPAHLIIIPWGPLFYLPFQALIWTSEDDRSDHAYLVDRYAISYASGVIMVKYVESLGQRSGETSTFIGFANPDTGEDAPRLPEAGTEAYRISVSFPVAQVYVGQNANEDVVRTKCGEAQLILFAVHGKFDPANAMYSYLALTPTQDNDGKLHAREVLDLALKADMVVLSACETLLPSLKDMQTQVQEVTGNTTLNEGQLKELTLGRDFVGLTQSFLESGAASVLASLWSVPSKSTAELMVSFYRHLAEGMGKAEALRAAQLEVMNTTGSTHPWYWAAFNLMGDWR
jgi:tetratricopeptide (TPR) repeat protein